LQSANSLRKLVVDRPRISVVVSTCNRSGELPLLFDALARQTLSGRVPWELVIVNNRSTDNTAEVIGNLVYRSPFPVYTLFEGRRGKSHGLNTGQKVARGDIIAFTDDDGVPADDWLECILAHFDNHADAVCVGGRVELFDPADAPITIRTSRETRTVDIATFDPAFIAVIGCNLAIRKHALDQTGTFDVTFGPGAHAGTAEDVDFLYRIVSAGHHIHYNPEILILHRHGRRSAEQVSRVRKSYLTGRGAFYCKYVLSGDRMVSRWAYRETRRLVQGAVRSGLVTSSAREDWRALAILAGGALRYLRYRQRVVQR
jgi:GT2 family glycosyltransferase